MMNELREIDKLGYIAVAGEASEDDILLTAGIERACGLIAVVSSDADNLYITLTARGLNPSLFILARSSGSKGTRTKLLRAGAIQGDFSLLYRRPPYGPAYSSAQCHRFSRSGHLCRGTGLAAGGNLVRETASFANKNLMDSGIRRRHDVIVVAIKRQDGDMLFNPKPGTMILSGDIMIVLGEGANSLPWNRMPDHTKCMVLLSKISYP